MCKSLYGKTRKEVQEIFHLRLGEKGDLADHTGQQLDNYCSSRLMGVGGFARVYLGEHIHVDFETLFSHK